MAHANSNTHLHSNRHWRTPRTPQRRFVWDVALVLAIVLSIAFLATRVDSSLPLRVAGMLGQNSSVTQDRPLSRSMDQTDTSELIVALKNPIPDVRINAAQSLGSKHALAATDALIAATYDSNARMREEAVAALGDLGATQALPRLWELQIFPTNTYVTIAAFEAEGKITNDLAMALGVPRSSVQALTVAKNGAVYVAALNNFYALKDGEWQQVSYLPASPNDISASPDGRLIFMSTVASGLYQSQDAGNTWEHVQYGLQTPTQLRTTAVVIDPSNINQIYAAVAVNGSTSDLLNPLGVVSSNDGGKTWLMLEDLPHKSVTTMLMIDPSTHQFLYGMSDIGSWVYPLSSGTTGSTSIGK